MESVSHLPYFFPDAQQQPEPSQPNTSRRGSVLSSILSGSGCVSTSSASIPPSASGPKCGVKRSRDETKDGQPPSRDSYLVIPEPKRRRIQTDTDFPLPFSTTSAHTEGKPTSTTTSPPATPPELPCRDWASKVALGLWIGEYLCDRFSTPEFRFVENHIIMKEMSGKLVSVLDYLDPHNSIALAALIYLERLIRGIKIGETFSDRDRATIMYRSYLLALHFAFIWLEDIPWSLSKIAECMEVSLEDARLWEHQGLSLLDYNLFIAEGIWPAWLDMLHKHAAFTECHDHIGLTLQDIFLTAKDEYRASVQHIQAPSPASSPSLPSPPHTPPPSALAPKVATTTVRELPTPHPGRSSSLVKSKEDWDSGFEFSTASLEHASAPDRQPSLFDATLPILQPKPVLPAHQHVDSLLMAVA
ncbi:hypothetical protein Moror_3087 [Moniliophthora roreri MCA 2997]|uniref:Uncharacterized protein n=2 Tax=Moniliophthora roreri TaxID=221103 RepID=V2WP95_MONRO|nr:hypothetical protein Moror_3087 [Moniliophthora roreri MCA 2997]